MSRIDILPPDQRAVLQLLLQKDRSYQEIARLLRLDVAAVRGRAHAAVDALGPEPGVLTADQRGELSDFLLGEQSASARAATRAYLEGSTPARTWAVAAAAELRPLAGDKLPEIPPAGAEVVPEPAPAPTPPPPPPPEPPAPVEPSEPAPWAAPWAQPEPEPAPPEPEPEPEPEPAAPWSPPAEPEPAEEPAWTASAEPAPVDEPEPELDFAFPVSTPEPVTEPEPEPEPAPEPEPITGFAPSGAHTEPVADEEQAEADEAATTPSGRSRLTGTLIIFGLAILIAVLLVKVLSSGEDDTNTSPNAISTPPATQTTPAQRANTQIQMTSPSGATSPLATATLLRQNGSLSLALAGQGLEPTTTTRAYALWSVNSATDTDFLGWTPRVGKDGRLRLFAQLPDGVDPSKYRELWLTSQVVTASSATQPPTRPGKVVLIGPLE